MTDSFGIVRYGRDEMQQYEHPMADGSADIEPGMLLERVNDAGDIKVQPHSTDAGTEANTYIAIEARGRGMNAMTGDAGNTDDPDVYSTSGDSMVRYVRLSGGGVFGRLAAGSDLTTASDAAITVGDVLVSAGDGTLRGVNNTDGYENDALLFEAEESEDNQSAASGDTTLVALTPL